MDQGELSNRKSCYNFHRPNTHSQMLWEGLSIVSCLKEKKLNEKFPYFTCPTGSFLDYFLSLND